MVSLYSDHKILNIPYETILKLPRVNVPSVSYWDPDRNRIKNTTVKNIVINMFKNVPL